MKKLKFYGLGYNDINQAYIKIYDKNSLIYCGKTYNNELKVDLKECKIYKLIAKSNSEILTAYFYVTDRYEYSFVFNSIIYINNPITFLLTDYYYNNLPIERGEIILWKNQ